MIGSRPEEIGESMVQSFLDKGERQEAFMAAVIWRLKDRVNDFLSEGISVNWQDCRGVTALMIATIDGDHRFVKLLLDHGADVHIRSTKGATALHSAVSAFAREADALKVVELLLEAGADKTVVNNEGNTAWYYAQQRYTGEILSLLSE